MDSTNKHFYFGLFKFSLLLVVIFTISSCGLEETVDDMSKFAELEVYVSGTLSGNPRSGLKVAIYETEENAQNEVNAITYPQTTDSDGFAFFGNLEPGFRYWVRVDTTLIHNINHSQVLTAGFNEMSMTIL
jgi:hypothetical protein